MAYLSQIPLNPLRRQAQALLNSPQKIHAAVMASLPYQPEEGRHLWRLEQRKHRVDLLALSPERPSWEHLIEQAGWPGADDGVARIASLDPLMDLIMLGRRFTFRLRANPIQNVRRPDHPTANQAQVMTDPSSTRYLRLGQRTVRYQLEWFLKRCSGEKSDWGFTVGSTEDPSVALVGRQILSFSKGRGKDHVTLNTATFEGKLTVTNVDLMRQSLLKGIGSGKAYGCGLLTLAAA